MCVVISSVWSKLGSATTRVPKGGLFVRYRGDLRWFSGIQCAEEAITLLALSRGCGRRGNPELCVEIVHEKRGKVHVGFRLLCPIH